MLEVVRLISEILDPRSPQVSLGGGSRHFAGPVNKWQYGRAPPRIAKHQVRISAHGKMNCDFLCTQVVAKLDSYLQWPRAPGSDLQRLLLRLSDGQPPAPLSASLPSDDEAPSAQRGSTLRFPVSVILIDPLPPSINHPESKDFSPV